MKIKFIYAYLLAVFAVTTVSVQSCKKTSTTTSTSATVTALNCSSTMFSGTPVISTAFTGTATVPYTGGSGIAHSAGTAISSTGVTGLTATLQAGTLAVGAGNLVYTIAGTPTTSGTATFAITFGGQTCSFALTVNAASTTTTGCSTATTTAAKVLCAVQAFEATLSATQLAGVMGWIYAPGQAIEILIAVSILISAIHAFQPVFPNREMYIAGGFGLIHGLAFASTLANLNLETSRMVLSILGFNIGIELMQLFVIAIIIPWLILLSRLPVYKTIRVMGAVFAAIASLAWIVERTSTKANPVSLFVLKITVYAPYLVLILAAITIICYALDWNRKKATLSGY